MKQPLFITGLARSRSAWMANWLTTEHSFCYHDLPYGESLVVGSDRRIGFAGSDLAKQFKVIREHHPEAPWLVVLRNSGEAFHSFKAKAGNYLSHLSADDLERWWHERCEMLAHICVYPHVQTVTFEALDDENTARLVWAHLLPGIAFDVARWKLLCGLNVQQDKKLEKAYGLTLSA